MNDEPTQLYKTTFQHIYYSNGFALSKSVAGNKKAYTPKSVHACFQSGYWCEGQSKEEGMNGIIIYLKRCGVKNPKTVIKSIKKYE